MVLSSSTGGAREPRRSLLRRCTLESTPGSNRRTVGADPHSARNRPRDRYPFLVVGEQLGDRAHGPGAEDPRVEARRVPFLLDAVALLGRGGEPTVLQ